jgi:hypothetical protein
MKMKTIFKKALAMVTVCSIGSAMIGCNVGVTPPGGSDSDVKAAFDKQPIEVRARETMGSPAPLDFKLNRIKEMYKKEGKPVPPEFQGAGSTNAH